MTRSPSASRLLWLSPAWPAVVLCAWGAVRVGPRWWGPAGGLFAAVGLASGLTARRLDRSPTARVVAGWLPTVWRAVAVPVAGWGLLMLPTCWFSLGGLFALLAAAFLIGYASDLAAAGRQVRDRHGHSAGVATDDRRRS